MKQNRFWGCSQQKVKPFRSVAGVSTSTLHLTTDVWTQSAENVRISVTVMGIYTYMIKSRIKFYSFYLFFYSCYKLTYKQTLKLNE